MSQSHRERNTLGTLELPKIDVQGLCYVIGMTDFVLHTF